MKIKTRRYYIYYASKILFFAISLIPRKISLVIADFLGRKAFSLLPKYRDITISNLNEAFGGDHEKNLRMARDVFRGLAKSGADWIKLMSLGKKGALRLVSECQGLEYLDKTLGNERGAILLASHFGNWELLSAYLSTRGYKGAIIVRRLYFYKYDNFIVRLRRKFGVQVVYRDESPKKLLKVLKKGEMLGILADQDVDSTSGVFVNFFGKSAYTPTAPVKFAMAARVDIVPAFMIRKPDDSYKLVVEKPITLLPEKDKAESVRKYTQLWTDILEKYVRQYPEQWVWLHRRWKTEK
ncbi:MAG: lysophospholipid acyltransferase family protein [Candidatus Omnitrophota bacterium]